VEIGQEMFGSGCGIVAHQKIRLFVYIYLRCGEESDSRFRHGGGSVWKLLLFVHSTNLP
jgi:hypothetical protein